MYATKQFLICFLNFVNFPGFAAIKTVESLIWLLKSHCKPWKIDEMQEKVLEISCDMY